jgi:hypothetical protein
MRHLIFKRARTQKPDSTFAGRARTTANLAILQAGDKRALVPKGATKSLAAALLPSYKHREPLFFSEISEDSHAAKPPCAG